MMDNYMDNTSIPYYVYEGTTARHERTVKRLIVCLIISIVLMFACNALWLCAWTQYDYSSDSTTENIDIDGKDGIANYIGNDGDISNGSDTNNENVQK